MKNFKLFCLLPLAFVCFAPHSVFAFRCAMPTPKAEFGRADAVFSGEAVAQESRTVESEAANGARKLKVTITATEFKVQNFWKGDGDKTLFLISHQLLDQHQLPAQPSRFYNSFSFVLNKKYLVYAYQSENALQASGRCSRTRPFDAATIDLRELGDGDTPQKSVDRTLREFLNEYIEEWNN